MAEKRPCASAARCPATIRRASWTVASRRPVPASWPGSREGPLVARHQGQHVTEEEILLPFLGGQACRTVEPAGARGPGRAASQLTRPAAAYRTGGGAPATEPARGLLDALQRRVVLKFPHDSPLQLHGRQGEQLRESDQQG